MGRADESRQCFGSEVTETAKRTWSRRTVAVPSRIGCSWQQISHSSDHQMNLERVAPIQNGAYFMRSRQSEISADRQNEPRETHGK